MLKLEETVYAIRHIPSGRWMPQRRRPGYSLVEAEEFSPSKPRLFWSRSGASRALAAWLRGIHAKAYNIPGTGPDYEPDYDSGGYPVGPPPANRIAADMEIVCFNLEEQAVIYVPKQRRLAKMFVEKSK